MIEHGQESDDDELRLIPSGTPVVDGGRGGAVHRSDPGSTRRRLAPRPEKGLAFDEALEESMRDYRAVYAALAK